MNKLRFLYHKYLDGLVSIGENVRIGHGTVFSLPLWIPYVGFRRKRIPVEGGISIGNNVDIAGNNVIVYGCEKPTKIEDDVWIAHNSVIGHDVTIGKGTVISATVTINGLVEIGEYCFLASGTTVQPRLKIGDFSLIGTQSNVNRDIPESSIAYGNPCKRVKENIWRPAKKC